MNKITKRFPVGSGGAEQTYGLTLLGKIKGTGQVVEIEITEAQVRALFMPARLSIGDVAQRYGRDRRTVRRWVKDNRLPYFKVGGVVFFDPSELERMERSGTVQGRGLP